MPSDSCGCIDVDDEELTGSSEREFVGAIILRADSWVKFGLSAGSAFVTRDPGLVLFVDVCSPTEDHVLRTLRVEFDEEGVRMGEDPGAGQGGIPLEASRKGVVTQPRGARAAAELGELAAQWIERELCRPIERWEWTRPGFHHRRWVLADTGEPISWSDSQNEPRRGIGAPDSVVVVRDFR